MPQINRDLNLVFPVEIGEGAAKRTFHVHSTPISMEVFENYFLTLSSAYAAMSEKGFSWVATMGPRMALMMLKKIAKDEGTWEGAAGIEKGLLGEIFRMTTVLMPNGAGWEQMPWDDVKSRALLPTEETNEVENAIVFFTSAWHCEMKNRRKDFLETVFGLFGGELTSSTVMEFQRSLATSSATDPIGATEELSVIPI